MQATEPKGNWYQSVERRKPLLVSGIIVVCLVVLAVTLRRNNVSYDSFWHLRSGLDWLHGGMSLWRDHFSFTFNGAEIADPPYMFQVLLAWLVTQFGLQPGFEAYKLFSFILVFGLVTAFLHRLRSPVFVYCLVLPLLVVLLQFRSMVRPELLSYSLSVVAIMLYYRARHRLAPSVMLPILVLMLFWSNYQQPVVGYIVFSGLFVDTGLQLLKDRASPGTWFRWLGWGLAILAVGFLRPGFTHPLVNLLHFAPEWKVLIKEFQSPADYYRGVVAIYALIAVAVATLAMLYTKRRIGLLLVCTLLVFFAAQMVRLVTPGGIVILCTFAWIVREFDPEVRLRRGPAAAGASIGAGILVLFVLAMTTAVGSARKFMEENRISANLFPTDVADYMISQDISGRIFNAYEIGGYLIYRLSPHSQVYIDGRTNMLYPLAHYDRHWRAERSSGVLRAELGRFGIELAVLQNRQRNYALVKNAGLLGLDFVGARYSLFRKDRPNFPVLGSLLAYPACWGESMSPALEAELSRARTILPGNSPLPVFASLLDEYGKAGDKAAFLAGLKNRRRWSADTLRFAGHQSLIHDLDALAHAFLAAIPEKEFSDYLGAAHAKTRLGEWRAAERLLDAATRLSASEQLAEITLLHAMLKQVERHAGLEFFDQAHVNRLAADIGAAGGSTSRPETLTHLFCPDA